MSTTIDQRVVEMRFDNRQFESNVQTSMSTLEKLKQGLNLTGASKGLDNINKAAKNNNLGILGSAADTVGLKFSALYTYADQTMRGITDSVNRTAKKMVSALTIDPIKSGLSEYETQINSVQTILANTQAKGTNIDQVNGALDELNKYADKTIYNFTEMTRNIGTFTAAGVDLDKSVQSIKGIANLAAVSGSSSQQASTAMYQLSQALAAGKVSLMDWNSVVNAGMGGEVFQNALKRTSEMLGTGAEEAIKEYGTFRESLTKGQWLTTEVLTETLAQLSGAYSEADLIAQGYSTKQAKEIIQLSQTANDAATKVKTFTQLIDTTKESLQSGWTQTWEYVIGDFEQAKKLWTAVSDEIGGIIEKSSENRNKVVGDAMTSNWDKMIDKIQEAGVESTVFEDKLKNTLKNHGYDVDYNIKKYGSLGEAFQAGALPAKYLTEVIDGLSTSMVDLSSVRENLKIGETGEDVKKVQEALKNLKYDIGETGADGIFGGATESAIKAFQEANELEVTGIVDEKTLEALEKASSSASDLKENCESLIAGITELGGRQMLIQSFANIWEGLKSVVTPIKEAFDEIFPPTTAEQLTSFIESIMNFTEKLKLSGEQSEKVKSIFKGFFSIIDIGLTIVKTLAGGIMDIVGYLFGFGDGILSAAGSFGDWITGIRDSIKETDLFGKAVDKVVGFITGTIDKIKAFGSSLKENFKTPDMSGGIFGFFRTLWNMTVKIGSVVATTFGSITSTIAEAFGKGDIFEVLNSGLITGIFFGITQFTKSLTDGFDGVNGILENVTGILDDVRGCFQAYQEQLKAGTLMKIAMAIGILAASIFVISTIDPDSLAQSLGAITVLFVELLGSLAIFDKMGGAFKGTLKAIPLMISLASAILILAIAMRTMANLSWEGVAKGLVSIAGLMASLFIFLKYANFNIGITTAATGILLLASSMVVMSYAVRNFSNISWEGIAKGLIAIGVLMAELVIFMKYAKLDAKMAVSALGFVAMAAAMRIFASAMVEFGSMSWGEIGRGLVAMTGALAAMTIALQFVPTSSVLKAAGIIVAAMAIKVLHDVLSELGGLSWAQMSVSLSTLGGALSMLSFGLKAMKGSIKGSAALLIASGALAILAPVMVELGKLEWIQIGKGLVAMAGAFAVFGLAGLLLAPITPALLALSTALAVLGLAMVGIGAGLALIGVGITSMSVAMSAGAISFVAGLSTIVLGILELVPQIAQIIGRTILETAAILGDYIPQLAESFCKLIVGVVDSLSEYAPQLVDSLLTLIIDVINGLSDHIPALIEALANLVGNIFKGVVSALKDVDGDTLLKGVAAVGLMAVMAHLLSGVVAVIPSAMVGLLGVGALIAELVLILAAIGGISKIPGLKWLISEGGDLLEDVGRALGKAVGGLIGGIGEAISNSLPIIGANIASLMASLAIAGESAKDIDGESFDGVSKLIGVLGDIAVATVGTSISDIFTLGGTSMERFQKDGVAFFTAMKAISSSASGTTLNEESVDGIISVAIKLTDLQSHLKPIGGVMDWFTGRDDLATFGRNASAFVLSMKSAFGGLEGVEINVKAVKDIISVSFALSELRSSLDNIGGVLTWFTGRNDLKTFGDNAGDFITSMTTALGGLNGTTINVDALNTIIDGAIEMSELQTSLESIEGVVDWFTGRDDLGTFGENAASFIGSMQTALSELKDCDFNAEALTAIITASSQLSELQKSLSNIGGVIDWFTGRDDLATFGVNAGLFIVAMKTALGSLDGVAINTEALSAIITASEEMSKLQKSLSSIGGVIDWFTGRDDLATFGTNAGWFIYSMKTAMKQLDGVTFNSEAMTAIITAATELSTLQSSIESIGGVVDWFTGRDDLGTFGTNVGWFILSMKTALKNLDGITLNSEALTAIITAATELSTLQSSIESIGGVVDWFTGRDDLGTFGTNAGWFILSMKTALNSLGEVTFNSEALTAIIDATTKLSTLQSSLEPIGGVITWFTGRDDLSTFGNNVNWFIISMKAALSNLGEVTFNSEALGAIIDAATKLSEIQSSLDNVGGVISFFTGEKDLGSFGANIGSFLSGMTTALGEMGDVSFKAESLTAIVEAAVKLSEIQSSLDSMGGVLEFFTGEKNLGTFGSNIGTFLTEMSTALSGLGDVTFNAESMTAIISAATEMSALQSSLDSMGGVIEWFTGTTNLGTFGSNVADFIGSMKTAFISLEGVTVNSDAMSSIISAATELATLQESLANMGGVIEFFTGEKNLGTFGTQIGEFGIAMGKLRDGMGENGISETVVASITNAGNALIALNNALPEKGWFDSKEDLTDFSGHITTFATALAEFSSTCSGMNADGINVAITTANRIRSLVDKLADLDISGITLFAGDMYSYGSNSVLSTIGQAISGFADSVADINISGVSTAITVANKIKDFINNLASLDTSGVSSFTESISTLGQANVSGLEKTFSSVDLSSVGSNLMSSLTSGMKNSGASLSNTANTMIGTITNSIGAKSSSFSTAGGNLMANLVKGIQSKASLVKVAASATVSGAAGGVMSQYSKFYANGRYLGEGLVVGINSKKSAVYWAAYELGQRAVQGEKDGQKSNSPSKATIQAGNWFGEGLIIGINDMGTKVYRAGHAIGDTAVKSLSTAMARTSELVNGGMFDNQPTIRPVLDLSDVKAGAGSIGNLLGMGQTIGVSANVGAVSASMNSRIQNGGNGEVVSAINKLSKQLSNVGGSTYNVNGVTYDDGTNVSNAVQSLIRAAKIEGRA